jgi:hypothetical protein
VGQFLTKIHCYRKVSVGFDFDFQFLTYLCTVSTSSQLVACQSETSAVG